MTTRIKKRAKAKMWRKVRRNGNGKYMPHQGGGQYTETPGSIRSAANTTLGLGIGIAALIAAAARRHGRRRR